MIVLKRIAPGQQPTTPVGGCYEIAGTLSGTINGSNQVFYTEFDYMPNSISVLYNGQALHSPGDFLETGDNEITLIYLHPGLDDVLRANYEIKDCPQEVTDVIKKGIYSVANGVDNVFVAFDTLFSGTNYVVTTSLTNMVDAKPSVYPYMVGSKTTSGFSVYFQGYIDSSNYFLEWIATGL